MASTETGEIFTQEQVDLMTPEEREQKGIVPLTQEEKEMLERMPNRAARRKWLSQNKKFKQEKK